MPATTQSGRTVQAHRVFIKATPEAIWDVLTIDPLEPEGRPAGGCGLRPRPSGARGTPASTATDDSSRPQAIIVGDIVETQPPRRLVQTWRAILGPESMADGYTRLTWEIDDVGEESATKVTMTRELDGMPGTVPRAAGQILDAGDGWSAILRDLKTRLETPRQPAR